MNKIIMKKMEPKQFYYNKNKKKYKTINNLKPLILMTEVYQV